MIFDTASTGETIQKVTLQGGGLTIALLDWGAILQDLRLDGIAYSLTPGSETIADYEGAMCHHGSIIGPIANRISTGRVDIDGMVYELERNQDKRVHLHSGRQATHRRKWAFTQVAAHHATLELKLIDGACGLPGNRVITADFTLKAPATLTLTISATTDAPTLMNCANHSFWNLDGTPTWEGHQLWINADHYLPTNADTCPTGQIAPVTDTAMDFRTPRAPRPGKPAFDHNFCLSDSPVPLRDVLRLTGQSGLRLTMATDQPGLQIYDGANVQRPGRARYEAFAFEAQGWPDAPTHSHFPSIRITPDTPYRQTTEFRFDRPS